VIRAEYLELRFGISYWMQAAQTVLALLGVLAILAAPANWKWKLVSVLLLAISAVWVHFRSVHSGRSGTIRLFNDGTALLTIASKAPVNAVQGPNGWVSRWFSILTLREADSGRKHHCVVCASDNHPDEYRRLLKFLRMHSSPADVQGMIR